MGLALTRARLRDLAATEPGVIVALSGGKDSLVTLDLCCEAFARVEAVLYVVVPGLECVERPAQQAAARVGVPLHYVEHMLAQQYLKRGTFRFPSVRSWVAPRRKLADCENEIRAFTGLDLVAYGYRQNDSVQRRAMLRHLATPWHDPKTRHLHPIWDWSTREVLTYLRVRRIPIPEQIAATAAGSGMSLNRREVVWIHEHYPEDYQRLERAFPFVGAWLARDRFAKDHHDGQVPALHDGAAAPLAAHKPPQEPA